MKVLATFIILLISLLSNWAYGGWKIKSEPVKLVGGDGEIYMRPQWSTKGPWIALTTAAYRGIWVVSSESHDIREVTEGQGSGFGFRWSNNGREIVYITTDYEGKIPFNQLKVFDVENNVSRVITDGKQRFRGLPRWTKGDQHVYIMGRKTIQVFNSNPESVAVENVSENARMIYSKSDKIVVESFGDRTTDEFEPVSGMGIINLEVSPDETKIAFEAFGGDMYVMNADGKGVTDLGVGYRPKWSPDGQYLAYMITEDDGHRFTRSDIYTIRIDGSEKTNLTNTSDIIEMNPSWSPDGNQIAFDTYNDGSIYIVQVEK